MSAADTRALAHDLHRALAGEVRFSPGTRALYATGGSNYRQLPIGVVLPRSVDDVVAAARICREHDVPLLPRGGGTSLAGQACNVAVVLDFTKHLNRVLELDPERKLARVEPGVVLDDLRRQAERHGLTFGPDPSTHDHCTLGGMIGNNSCGTHSVLSDLYGPGPRTSDNVHELDVLLSDGTRLTVGPTSDEEHERILAAGGRRGEIHAALRALAGRYAGLIRERYPRIPRRVSGYNLDDLLPEHGFDLAAALCGTEGTCATVLEATVALVDSPPCRSLLVLGFEDAPAAGDRVPEVLEHRPVGLEGIDEALVQDMTAVGIHRHDLSLLPDGHGWLLVEFGGETKDEADEQAHRLVAALRKGRGAPTGVKLYDDAHSEQHVWDVREAALGATAFLPGRPDTYEGWEDSAVPPERVGEYLRRLRELAGRYGYESALYGHYGQGCIHARWNFDLTSTPGIRTFRAFLEDASDLVLELGGSISGEHGDGQSKAELLPKMFGPELVQAFREFKAIWDPEGRMNPGKVVDPDPIDSNLRLGPDYDPPRVRTHFAYAEDGGSFAHATVRCVGIGKCRRTDGGVMCPSYMVTREEQHATRGRARLLFEMLRGDELERWHSAEILEALDLCLSCKGCTHDCPVGVDMPTLKAEYLARYYARRPRPRPAYAFGFVDVAARAASRAPSFANLVTQHRPLSSLAKRAAGVAPQRALPPFARTTARAWFEQRAAPRPDGPPVVLWPDTFTNHFEPRVAIAAVETLERSGYRVSLPRGGLCCGRPLYDYGMLRRARRYLERVVAALREEIRAGVPVVGVEPSCVAVFKDELPKLLPHDEDGRRLSRQTFHFAELLERDGVEPPPLSGRALVHEHCHQRATGGIAPDRTLLERMGLDVAVPDSGCCGMAGGWGYERGHYDVSVACAERALLPAVRAEPETTLVVADGFSCRTQIEHGHAGRRALHVAEVLRMAAG